MKRIGFGIFIVPLMMGHVTWASNSASHLLPQLVGHPVSVPSPSARISLVSQEHSFNICSVYGAVQRLSLDEWRSGSGDLHENIKRHLDATGNGKCFLQLCQVAESADNLEDFFTTCLSPEDALTCKTTQGKLANYITLNALRSALACYRTTGGRHYPLELVGQRLSRAESDQAFQQLSEIYGTLSAFGASHDDGLTGSSGKYLAQVIRQALVTQEHSARESLVKYAITLIQKGVPANYHRQTTDPTTATLIRMESARLTNNESLRLQLLKAVRAQEEWKSFWDGANKWPDFLFQRKILQLLPGGDRTRLLEEHGGWNVLDDKRTTPLYSALENTRISASTVKLLLDAGASLNILSFRRSTGLPWDFLTVMARIYNHPDHGLSLIQTLWNGKRQYLNMLDWQVMWLFSMDLTHDNTLMDFFLDIVGVDVNTYVENCYLPLDRYASPEHWDFDWVLKLLMHGANWTQCHHPDSVIDGIQAFFTCQETGLLCWRRALHKKRKILFPLVYDMAHQVQESEFEGSAANTDKEAIRWIERKERLLHWAVSNQHKY